jgi:hypothetical protein
MFASAGLLEGMDQDHKQRERGFDEDLQTKVYMDAHNAQRQGKKGLGKSTTLKIAGGWVDGWVAAPCAAVGAAADAQRLVGEGASCMIGMSDVMAGASCVAPAAAPNGAKVQGL